MAVKSIQNKLYRMLFLECLNVDFLGKSDCSVSSIESICHGLAGLSQRVEQGIIKKIGRKMRLACGLPSYVLNSRTQV